MQRFAKFANRPGRELCTRTFRHAIHSQSGEPSISIIAHRAALKEVQAVWLQRSREQKAMLLKQNEEKATLLKQCGEKAILLEQCQKQVAILSQPGGKQKAVLPKEFEQEEAKWLKEYEREAALRKELEEEKAILRNLCGQQAFLLEECQKQVAILPERGEKRKALLPKEFEEEKANLLKQYELEAALRKELEEQKATLFQQCQEQMAILSERGERQQAALRKDLEEEKVESVKQYEHWDASRKELKKEKATFLEDFKKQMALLSKQCEEYGLRGVSLEGSKGGIKLYWKPGEPQWYQMRHDQRIEKSQDLFGVALKEKRARVRLDGTLQLRGALKYIVKRAEAQGIIQLQPGASTQDGLNKLTQTPKFVAVLEKEAQARGTEHHWILNNREEIDSEVSKWVGFRGGPITIRGSKVLGHTRWTGQKRHLMKETSSG